MAAVSTLKTLLISQRNDSLKKLEQRYNGFMADLRDKKRRIALWIEQQFDEQMERVHKYMSQSLVRQTNIN